MSLTKIYTKCNYKEKEATLSLRLQNGNTDESWINSCFKSPSSTPLNEKTERKSCERKLNSEVNILIY